jgi:hypothetical protein
MKVVLNLFLIHWTLSIRGAFCIQPNQTESGICPNRGSRRESNLYRYITDSEKFERVLDQVTHVFDLAEKRNVVV